MVKGGGARDVHGEILVTPQIFCEGTGPVICFWRATRRRGS